MLLQHQPQVPENSGLARVDLKRPLVATARGCQALQFLPHRPEIQVGWHRIGLQRDGLGVGVRGFLMLAHGLMGHPQVEPILETLRSRFRQIPAVAHGRRVVFALERQRRQRLQRDRRLRPQLGQHLRIASRRLVVLLFEEDTHQVRQCLLAPRVPRQHFAVVCRRFGQLAGLLQGDSQAKQRLLIVGKEIEIPVERFQRLGRAPAVDQAEA